MTTNKRTLVIGLVGVCASGKTTLGVRLRARGWQVKHIAQEHSFVKDMWKKIGKPDLLVFLDVTYGVALRRRPLDWTQADYDEQQRRLAYAREHADLYIQTDALTADEVETQAVAYLEKMEAKTTK
jgi:thymidylate kinase